MPPLTLLARRLVALATVVAICGMFGVRSETIGSRQQAQFRGPATSIEFVGILPDQLGQSLNAQSWLRPVWVEPVSARFVLPSPRVTAPAKILASRHARFGNTSPPIVGTVELRI